MSAAFDGNVPISRAVACGAESVDGLGDFGGCAREDEAVGCSARVKDPVVVDEGGVKGGGWEVHGVG